MTLPHILGDLVVFLGAVFGLGLLWCPRGKGDALEQLTWAAALGLAQLYAGAWVVYLSGAPRAAYLVLPLLAAVALGVRWRATRALFSDPQGARALGQLLLFTGWCVGWLALVRCYGGGEWTGDWIEHYQRSRYFIDHQPIGTRFLETYGITARPPMANLVIGALLQTGDGTFPHAQVFTAVWSALILLPALLLVRDFGGGERSEAVLVVALMFSPFVIQNATFAWTKLPCAFFVLAAIALYRRGVDRDDAGRRTSAVALMTLGVLVHYSAVPYAVALAAIHVIWLWRRRGAGRPGTEFGLQTALAAGLLAPWLGWACWHFGVRGTFLDNPTLVGDASVSLTTRVGYRLQSAWTTLVPHCLRAADYQYIAQLSPAGYLRDYLFNIYQTTLIGAVGLGGLVLAVIARRQRSADSPAGAQRRFWWSLAGMVTLLNMAILPVADRWGTAHIGFAALVVTLFAYLAARAGACSRAAFGWWVLAAAVDTAFGIALHFRLQSIMPTIADLRRFVHGEVVTYAPAVARNALAKLTTGVRFVGDNGPNPVLVAAFLALLAALALRAVWQKSRSAAPQDHAR